MMKESAFSLEIGYENLWSPCKTQANFCFRYLLDDTAVN